MQWPCLMFYTTVGIVTLIVASANIDVVIAISLFSVFLGLIFSDGMSYIKIYHYYNISLFYASQVGYVHFIS